MASKRSVQEWRRAVDVLTSSATEFSGVEDKILPILKYSYDSLDGEMTKSCFLYCSLFPEDDLIDKERLIEYWIGEGFIDEKEGREKAMSQGYEILGTLVRACLLLVEEIRYAAEEYVKMHDVVREMAMWIASDLGKNKERCIVQARAGIREIPKVKNWKDVRRISLMANDIQIISESPDCPQLTTLILRENRSLEEISDGFFQSMPKLLVLDLSDCILSGFRMDMCNLVSLRYLNLSHTSISELPFGLERLKMLTHLNLESTKCLESLDGISGLSSLRTLKLLDSKLRLDMSLMEALKLLEHIEYISVNISTSTLVGEKLFDDPRIGRSIQQVRIGEEESVQVMVLPALDGLHDIFIHSCRMLEEIKIEKTPWNKKPPSCSSRRDEAVATDHAAIGVRTKPLEPPEVSPLCARELHAPPPEIVSAAFAAVSAARPPPHHHRHRVCFMLELCLHFSSAMNSVCGLRFSIPYLAGQLPCYSPLLLSPFQDLTWLLFASNLTQLYVHTSGRLEEIISKEKAASVLENNIIPFKKLQELALANLPELKSIYWNALPFQRLRHIQISGSCPKLRKLPLNSKSVLNVEKLVIECHDKEWLERVEWEDEATRLRFLPLCDQVLKDVSYLSCFKASHIKILEENLAAMQRDMEEHKVSHTDVLRRVEREEDTGSMQRLAEVKCISGEFFQCMLKLVVLNMSFNELKELPEEISGLLALRYLNLSWTKIERLPDGLGRLTRLRHLNLEMTKRLKSVDGLSDVLSLGVLRLQGSIVMLDASTIKELQHLGRLESLNIDISSSSALKKLA
ncbi:hypothetical protein IGI04_038675 [Brassica rapa subsp. trilocularis]|nr:hypothetical protein IGI04_038675 [Brassica rapa subsp. trilocularis]